MRVLIVNGRKINSFALSLECAADFALKGHDTYFLDLNPFVPAYSARKKVQRRIIRKYRITKAHGILYAAGNIVKAALCASSWFQAAKGSEKAWEETALQGKLPLGRLVKSLIARSMGSSNFLIVDCPPVQVYEIAFKSIFSYLQTASAIKKSPFNFELGIAHGGRDAYSAGAICAFRVNGVETRLIESGGVPSRWSMFETSPHFSPDFWSRLQAASVDAYPFEAIKDWWNQRLAGSDHFRTEEWGHTRTLGLLPPNLPEQYISFFTTSDFEIPVFDDFDVFPGEFQNQTQAFISLYEEARKRKIELVVRRHPNSINQFGEDRETALWETIRKLPGVTYLGPHDKIDSIALAHGSQIVFTFKSSVGIEAIWLGVPAFALGPARWAWTEDIRVWNLYRIREVLQAENKVNREHSLRWANMMLTMDFPNSEFESIYGNVCIFCETEVRNSWFEDHIDKFAVMFLQKSSKFFSKVVDKWISRI